MIDRWEDPTGPQTNQSFENTESLGVFSQSPLWDVMDCLLDVFIYDLATAKRGMLKFKLKFLILNFDISPKS